MNPTKTPKITKTTIKSFIKRYADKLYIKQLNHFDGMVDCVMPVNNSEFEFAGISKKPSNYNLGVDGAYFVGDSRDYFTAYQDSEYVGYEVSNCCGNYLLVKKI